MTDFRYAQFCPLARATEILGERWTLLVIRDLFSGMLRFSDLRAHLRGISSSVLADRLGRLEERGLVAQRELPPPAASTVYELTESGLALLPAVAELARWGARFLLPPTPGDHVEPTWATLGLRVFARPTPTPPLSFEVQIVVDDREARVFVTGGPSGTKICEDAIDADVVMRGEPMVLLGIMSGMLDPLDAARSGGLELQGDPAVASRFSELFQVSFGGEASGSTPQPN